MSNASLPSSVEATDELLLELRALASSMLASAQSYRSGGSSAGAARPSHNQPATSGGAAPASFASGHRCDATDGSGSVTNGPTRSHVDPFGMGDLSAADLAAARGGAGGAAEDALTAPPLVSPQAKMTATRERSLEQQPHSGGGGPANDASPPVQPAAAGGNGTGGSSNNGGHHPHSHNQTVDSAATASGDELEGGGGDDGDGAGSSRSNRDDHGDGDTTHVESENALVCDGVRTQMLFRVTDPELYAEMEASAWLAEPLQRDAHGNSVSADKAGDSRGDDDNTAADGADEGEAAAAAGGKSRDATVSVYRMPSFPFGGGVTEAQAAQLAAAFKRCIGRGQAVAAQGASARLITKADFDAYNYEEVAEDEEERLRAFRPDTIYEFVVEVEERVKFSASRASKERRKRFRQLARENKAPATVGTFDLRIIMDPYRTGFEEEKEFPIVPGDIVADRYQIIQLLGKATFSRAVRCYDLHQPLYDDDEGLDEIGGRAKRANKSKADEDGAAEGDGSEEGGGGGARREPSGYAEVCLKIINNSKDFFDQSLDEIRLLKLLNTHMDPDDAHVVRLLDAFYYKEHTMLVTELLSDNLYEYSKYNREEEEEPYFTLPRLRRITRQILTALQYVHSLNLVHADLKPENILFVSYRRCLVKVIDFGSSTFLSDHLSSYVQSRSYRAPEVVFGCDYDGRIDVWSLGAILYELATGQVLFTSETVPEMLARMVHVCGVPFPRHVLWEGRTTSVFVNKFGCIYEMGSSRSGGGGGGDDADEDPFYVYTPVPPAVEDLSAEEAADVLRPYGVLRRKLAAAGMADPLFADFVSACLTMDFRKRPTSSELLSHPFLAVDDDEWK